MNVSTIIKNKWVQTSAISVVTFVGGIGLGYIFGKKKALTTIDGKLTELIEEAKKATAWSKFTDEDEEDDDEEDDEPLIFQTDPELERLLDEEDQIERERSEREEATFHVEEEPTPVNVFRNPDSGWDYEAELSAREPEVPYVIHVEEFILDEMGYQQETLTYYAGDDIMADTDDTPIYNYAGLMGELMFGHGSRDPNVVYIRNEKIHMEWEVLLHPGFFAVEVLGMQIEKDAEDEIRHSYAVPKFRRE